MNRREFIAGLGSAAAWPMAVRGQQQPKVPVIGYLSPAREPSVSLEPFLQGLREIQTEAFLKGLARSVVILVSRIRRGLPLQIASGPI